LEKEPLGGKKSTKLVGMKEYINKVKVAVINLLRKEVVPPSYEEKRATIDFYRKKFAIQTLVETGTFFGDTVEFFRSKFDKVYSIELSRELADKAVKRFEDCENVRILQGDSGELLASLIADFNGPALFWLDGHYSSEFFHNGEYIRTARAQKDTPVEKELDTLLNASHQHIILIDDARLFTGKNDYPTIKNIRKKVIAARSPYQVFVQNDVIIIIPHK
jgi:hypothetical protein